MGQLSPAQIRELLDGLLDMRQLLSRKSTPAKRRPQQGLNRLHRSVCCQEPVERSSGKLGPAPHHRTIIPDQYVTLSRSEETFALELKRMPLPFQGARFVKLIVPGVRAQKTCAYSRLIS